jgi:hypothetical protein
MAYLLPTAACFRSDRHNKNAETAIAIPQSMIEPGSRQSMFALIQNLRQTKVAQVPSMA